MVYSVNGEQYTRRKLLKINIASAPLTDYQMPKNISYESIMQSNLEDMRFTTLAGLNIPYWEETVTASTDADIWMKVPSISDSVPTYVWQYYGNPSVSSESSGSGTFDQFYSGGSTTNGVAVYPDNSKSFAVGNYAIRVSASISGPQIYHPFYLASNDTTPFTSPYAAHELADGATDMWRTAVTTYNYATTGDTTPHIYEAWGNTDNLSGFIDGAEKIATVDAEIPSPWIFAFRVDAGGSATTLTLDWGIVRKKNGTEPTWAADGNEQHQRRTPLFMN